MAISFQNALGIREQALSLRADRASMLSSNLANLNTPNYKARDMDFYAELDSRMSGNDALTMKSTQAGHMSLSASESGFDKLYRTPHQPSIDGNTVEEQVEHAEFMKNSMEFQVSFTLLNSSFKGLRKALRGE